MDGQLVLQPKIQLTSCVFSTAFGGIKVAGRSKFLETLLCFDRVALHIETYIHQFVFSLSGPYQFFFSSLQSWHYNSKADISFTFQLFFFRVGHDNGGEFNASNVQQFFRIVEATVFVGPAYYPQAQGLVESANKGLKATLMCPL